ncbi:3061_t:CDS:1, partial [Dentiscutata erythropus]
GVLREGSSDSKKEKFNLNDQILAEPAFKNPSSNLSREDRDLNIFYEKEAI